MSYTGQPVSRLERVPSTEPGPRKIVIAVDLSDESAYAVHWAVKNYIRPDDQVVILHVRPTSILYGADWGDLDPALLHDEHAARQMEDHIDTFTSAKAGQLAAPLARRGIPYRLHIVKDHDMKERICLEVERLDASACIMGSQGYGAEKRSRRSGLGSVSDYCVHHCACPVIVVRMPEKDEVLQEGPPPKGH